MRTTGMLMLSALPGVALGYLVLTAYVVNKVKPYPIARMPRSPSSKTASRKAPQLAATAR